MESVEVQVINVTAPFVLLSELKSSLLPKEASHLLPVYKDIKSAITSWLPVGGAAWNVR